MDFLNLTISYIEASVFEDLPLKQKKAILKNATFLLILLIAVYIYIIGTVVSQSAKRANLRETLEQVSALSSQTEHVFISESAEKILEYFILAGYEKQQNLESIKRISNVAANY